MKSKVFPGILGLCLAVNLAGAAVIEYADDMATDSNWRTVANEAPGVLVDDGMYGTDGYVLYGWNIPAGQYYGAYDAGSGASGQNTSLPSYISDVAMTTGRLWSGNGNYGYLETPGDPATLQQAAVLLTTVDDGRGALTLTIHRQTDQAFRLTLIVGGGDGGSKVGAVQSVDIDAGGVGSLTATQTGLPVVGIAYKSFDIGAGTDDVTVTLAVTGDLGENTHITGLAFDAVPEPATMGLLVIGGLGFLFRRRR